MDIAMTAYTAHKMMESILHYAVATKTSLQSLHDAEIPGSISWLPDGAWGVTIGNPVREREIVRSEAEALAWLRRKAKEIYGWEPK